jgi:hypothetical protein
METRGISSKAASSNNLVSPTTAQTCGIIGVYFHEINDDGLDLKDEVNGGEGKRTNVDASPCESPANRLSTRTSLLESKEGD